MNEKYTKWKYVDYYRADGLKRVKQNNAPSDEGDVPPWRDAPPTVGIYEWRGLRVLSKNCWECKCFQCKCAEMEKVTIEYDWDVQQKFCFESFCYSPKSCRPYNMGKSLMIPYEGEVSCPDEHGGFDDICTERHGWNT